MNKFFASFCISLLFYSAGAAQEVVCPITNYSTKEYGRDFNPENWSIAQDNRGIIYAANGFKLLEFDGHTWNSYPINKVTQILALNVVPSGIIYVGSQNEFGYFAPDLQTGLKYFSLSDSLDLADLEFSNIRYVNSFSGGVAFQAEEKLFIYKNGEIQIVNPSTTFHTSFVVNDELYIRERNTGLMFWKDGKLNKINGGELFRSTGIFLMLPFSSVSNKILIGTREIGFWIFDPSSENKFNRFDLKEQSLIDAAQITGGVLLNNGSFALSTMGNGIIILDTSGNISSIINQNAGLIDNDVKQLISDKDQNLWLALNNGISKIEFTSPISLFSERSGIEGSVNSVFRHNGLLYVGTTTGLYMQNDKQRSVTQFSSLEKISSPVRSLFGIDNVLLAGTDAGIFEIRGSDIEKISNEGSYTLYYSRVLKLLLSGGSGGLSVYIRNNSLKKISLTEALRSDIFAITGNGPGNSDSCEFWIGTRYEGVRRLILYKDLRCTIDHYGDISDGLPKGPVTPFNYEGGMIFATIEGLYKFTPENIVKESLPENIPDSLKNDPKFLKGYFSAFRISDSTTGNSVSAFADTPDRIWICADNQIGFYIKTDIKHFIVAPFSGIDAGKINTIYPENNDKCWFGTTEGLICYKLNSGKEYSTRYLSLIRKVRVIRSDSLLFPGTYFMKDTNGIRLTNVQPDFLKPLLTYRNNSLRFDFAATFFDSPDKMMFSCHLEGFDNAWTNWEHKYYQEYTNLREGSYTFQVRAKNVYGNISDYSSYSFTILPPWYRSFPAYAFYAIASLLLVWLIIRLYTIRLKKENIRLEGIVRERTAEVVRQRDVLEHQNKEIEDSIRYARRIQNAVLPADHDFAGFLPESFVFFKPRDIVSGDFYWISQVENILIISAADCTGHGVPGAFMSMLGVAFLNEIVNKDHITSPEIILNRLREKVIEALQQQGISGEASDGMDIVVVSINEETKKLYYSGAYNPLIMIRDGHLSEFSGDRMPIAIFDYMREFVAHEIRIKKGDLFYFFSDGYEDQFGGPEGRKFKSKRFKQLLLDISSKSMNEQKDIIERTFKEWKGDLNQVDDIVVIGVRI